MTTPRPSLALSSTVLDAPDAAELADGVAQSCRPRRTAMTLSVTVAVSPPGPVAVRSGAWRALGEPSVSVAEPQGREYVAGAGERHVLVAVPPGPGGERGVLDEDEEAAGGDGFGARAGGPARGGSPQGCGSSSR